MGFFLLARSPLPRVATVHSGMDSLALFRGYHGTLCFDERNNHPYLINIVKCFAAGAGGDCLIHQTSPVLKFEQQTCRGR